MSNNCGDYLQPPPAWMNAQSLYNYTASELTPSESMVTDEEEDVGVRIHL